MSAATVLLQTEGRGVAYGNLSAVLVTVTGVSTTYSSSGGGLPFDLTGVLQEAAPSGFNAPNYIQALNPSDIVGVLPLGLSTSGYLPTGFTLGTPTYGTPNNGVPWQYDNGPAATPGILATCPATIRLVGIGAAVTNHSPFGETADGSNSDSFTFLLLIMRNGANN